MSNIVYRVLLIDKDNSILYDFPFYFRYSADVDDFTNALRLNNIRFIYERGIVIGNKFTGLCTIGVNI